MKQTHILTLGKAACMAFFSLALLTACGAIGDTGAVKDANQLATDCRTEEALAAADRALAAGGVSMHLGGVIRVAILRDVGRDADAAQALADYLAMPDTGELTEADVEEAVTEFIAGFREERLAETGSETCT